MTPGRRWILFLAAEPLPASPRSPGAGKQIRSSRASRHRASLRRSRPVASSGGGLAGDPSGPNAVFPSRLKCARSLSAALAAPAMVTASRHHQPWSPALVEPTANEQLMLELVNRATARSRRRGQRQGIGLNKGLGHGTIKATAKQPLAMNMDLLEAARAHSNWMLDKDIFDHTGAGGSIAGRSHGGRRLRLHRQLGMGREHRLARHDRRRRPDQLHHQPSTTTCSRARPPGKHPRTAVSARSASARARESSRGYQRLDGHPGLRQIGHRPVRHRGHV